MRQNELPLLPELRQEIHDLVLTKRSTGLSPPEEEFLERLEAFELLTTRGSLCLGFINLVKGKSDNENKV